MVFAIRISSTPQSCLVSQPGDSESFANASAINDKYLAVGDPEANRVVIYTHDAKGKWLRTREILPPKGSEAEAVGSGFGSSVSLDKSTLVIGAFARKHKPKNPELFQYTNQLGMSYSGGVYKTTLDKETQVQRIDVVSKGEVPGLSISADGETIAYSTMREGEDGRLIGKIHLLSDGNIKHIVSPTDSGAHGFDVGIALKNNLLVAGSGLDAPMGAAWLFDLKAPKSKPQRLAIPNEYIGGIVAISDRFVAVSTATANNYLMPTKTLIVSIEDGSTTVIDGVGVLSLDRNILARMHPHSTAYDGVPEQQALLELFDLTNFNEPRLIVKRGGIEGAYVQNNFLITIPKSYFRRKICIEQVTK